MKRLVAAVAIASSLLGLSACKRPPGSVSGVPDAAAPATALSSAANAPIVGEFAPDPGPWQTRQVKQPDGTTMEAIVARGEVGRRGGTFTLSTFGTGPKTFNPWSASDVESDGFGLLQFEPLIRINAFNGQYEGRLAKSFSVAPDQKTYTFVLRKGVKWSDGKPITADDVVFTFRDLIGQGFGNSSRRDVLMVNGQYPKFEKVDDYTLRVTTPTPFAPLLSSLDSQAIAPKHILEAQTKKGHDAFNTFWDINTPAEQLVTSGPFRLERYVPSQRVELARNPNYYFVDKNGTKLPYLDRFVQLIVPDQNTMLLKFMGREIDFMDIRSVRGPDVAKLRPRRGTDNFTLYNLGPDDGTNFLIFNMCRRTSPKTKKPYVDPIKQEWFNNVNFRQAINHVIDRQRIVNNVLKGVGVPLYTAESTGSLFFDKELKPFPQDINYAVKLLQQGGFVKKGDRLYDAKGNPIEFTLVTNAGNSIRDGACITIVNELQKLGIKANYQPVDFNMLIDKIDQSLDWEACVMGLTGSRTEPYGGANIWKSNGRLHMFDQRLPNEKGDVVAPDARDWEKRIDQLFDEGATTLDFAKRKKVYDEYQQIVFDQAPFIYTYTSLDVTALRNSLRNYKPSKYGVFYTPLGSLHNIEEIYFAEGAKGAGENR